MTESRQNHDNNRANMKYLNDAIFEFVKEIAQEVYDSHDEIYSQASEGLLDDDHEEVDMNATDIITEMINERMK